MATVPAAQQRPYLEERFGVVLRERATKPPRSARSARPPGITKPTLYHFYGSKEGVYRALVEGALERFRAEIDRARSPGETPLREQLGARRARLLRRARCAQPDLVALRVRPHPQPAGARRPPPTSSASTRASWPRSRRRRRRGRRARRARARPDATCACSSSWARSARRCAGYLLCGRARRSRTSWRTASSTSSSAAGSAA